MKALFPDYCFGAEAQLTKAATGHTPEAGPEFPAARFGLRFNVDRVCPVFRANTSHCFSRLGFRFVLASGRGDYPDHDMRPCRGRIQELHFALSDGGARTLFQGNPDLRTASKQKRKQDKNYEGKRAANFHARRYIANAVISASKFLVLLTIESNGKAAK